MRTIAFFSNKGGVGKTTTVYHIAWMLAELNYKVLAADLDPQSNLTSLFLSKERMEEIVLGGKKDTILEAIEPVSEGKPYKPVHVERINENIFLLAGSLSLASFEDELSNAWSGCISGDPSSFEVTSVFKTLFSDAAQQCKADWVLIDLSPTLGATNRAIMISTDHIVLPLTRDMFSLQVIKNIGTVLKEWRSQWHKRKDEYQKEDKFTIANGKMKPIGYIVMQHTVMRSRQWGPFIHWADRIPELYNEYIGGITPLTHVDIEDDPNCLAFLKYFHSLAQMSVEARKPFFLLKVADGAIGAHFQAVKKSYADFKNLTMKIIEIVEKDNEQ